MKIIIPMAGRGTRLRPHTLTTPKPLIPIAGKPIVQRLIEDLVKVCPENIEEIAFVVGEFGERVEQELISIAQEVGAKGSIHYQDGAHGTAHAILAAEKALDGNVIVAFADTLFKADFKLDTSKDGIIWVQKVEDPSAFGVVKFDQNNIITDFVEKPQVFVSDLAIIGIYYFKDGAYLKQELQYLIDNDIRIGDEFGLTTALENMARKGTEFIPGEITEWLDCGNKNATVFTNQRYLEYIKSEKNLIDQSSKIENSTIIEPVYIGPNVSIKNSVIGPHVSLGWNSTVENCVISNSLIQQNSSLSNVVTNNTMIGSNATLRKQSTEFSVGDYNELIL